MSCKGGDRELSIFACAVDVLAGSLRALQTDMQLLLAGNGGDDDAFKLRTQTGVKSFQDPQLRCGRGGTAGRGE